MPRRIDHCSHPELPDQQRSEFVFSRKSQWCCESTGWHASGKYFIALSLQLLGSRHSSTRWSENKVEVNSRMTLPHGELKNPSQNVNKTCNDSTTNLCVGVINGGSSWTSVKQQLYDSTEKDLGWNAQCHRTSMGTRWNQSKKRNFLGGARPPFQSKESPQKSLNRTEKASEIICWNFRKLYQTTCQFQHLSENPKIHGHPSNDLCTSGYVSVHQYI